MLAPMGTLSFDEAYDMIASQIVVVKDEVDAVLFETMSDLYEVKAGILAVKENYHNNNTLNLSFLMDYTQKYLL